MLHSKISISEKKKTIFNVRLIFQHSIKFNKAIRVLSIFFFAYASFMKKPSSTEIRFKSFSSGMKNIFQSIEGNCTL